MQYEKYIELKSLSVKLAGDHPEYVDGYREGLKRIYYGGINDEGVNRALRTNGPFSQGFFDGVDGKLPNPLNPSFVYNSIKG